MRDIIQSPGNKSPRERLVVARLYLYGSRRQDGAPSGKGGVVIALSKVSARHDHPRGIIAIRRMLKLAFDRKSRVLQVSISGIFASEDMDELDNAVVEFVARHGPVRGIFDYSDVEAIAVPDSRLAERAQQPQVIEQRVVVASRATRGERARTYASYRREAGQRQAVIVDSLGEAYAFLDLRNPRFEPVER
ncbi:MAG TPA: hypothetical protein VGM96_16145 [Reyranella sp.]